MKVAMPELALIPTPAPAGEERQLPRNIEAEAAFLGAILIDNRVVEDLPVQLHAAHFFEPLHQTIYETAGSLIRMGKVATPVTLKTFLPADTDIGGMTVGQYLARLAAEALLEALPAGSNAERPFRSEETLGFLADFDIARYVNLLRRLSTAAPTFTARTIET